LIVDISDNLQSRKSLPLILMTHKHKFIRKEEGRSAPSPIKVRPKMLITFFCYAINFTMILLIRNF